MEMAQSGIQDLEFSKEQQPSKKKSQLSYRLPYHVVDSRHQIR
jgi:hypothetical protein